MAFIHETAVVDAGAEIGEGSSVWHFVHVCRGAKIGRGVVLGQNAFVADDVTIGNDCRIQNNVSIYTGVTLDAGVFVGPSAVFTNVLRPRARIAKKDQFLATHVSEGATIGANATIICGNKIGACAFIAAGSVVTRNVDSFTVVRGNPARPCGYVCRCGEALDFSDDVGKCKTCLACYRLVADLVIEDETRA
ncbi:MAG: UDP-2-acetamido-3-amino-2,3-dideoxy-glucuronate N-acetyltransferase [Planctomycetota bacterium]|jgi:UDP-2-acetamido-3-amino-2,3-dideoxy-glucuronate N-acetyltransferase